MDRELVLLWPGFALSHFLFHYQQIECCVSNYSFCIINRAVYHGTDMYLLDDVLSAVDSQVGSCILQRALLGPLLNKKTRIMCTHSVQVNFQLSLSQ